MTLRGELLAEAKAVTEESRNVQYGDPVSTHQHIAAIFNAITGRDITAREVALFHQATKIARRWQNPAHRDSYVDGMAYAGIEFECALAEAEGD